MSAHQLPEEEKDQYEGEDEFEDNEEEEEANEQMRQILMRELGSNYVEDEMSDDEDDDFMWTLAYQQLVNTLYKAGGWKAIY